jgi:hypothetical protein
MLKKKFIEPILAEKHQKINPVNHDQRQCGDRDRVREESNLKSNSRINPIKVIMSKTVYKFTAVLAAIPFAVIFLFGRLSTMIGSEEIIIVNFPVTMFIVLALAFLGGFASRKADMFNLNAIHGILGALQVSLLAFNLIPAWPIALASLLILIPVTYILITGPALNFRKPENNPVTGEPVISEITVWDVMTGKYKKPE